ncbi:CKLF-like MARVEL transmembrane domain-containing protein 6 [Microcaecilia unicolor]|uniref:CKLF-like MARVEL transmembrane domain-containing protein 6 n=1 Tax=Microcaecilia unicolor TaxID=1415580 RepID=A0A6P7YG64_9AMPH|nr:CKLF-like MARVEL transmembrane domain-containing protein 6 [Microcaecilia unicolor]
MADDSVNGPVYKGTTVPNPSTGDCRGLQTLGPLRLAFKVLQLLLSFVAFICEEIVEYCTSCIGLYFFEFVSCSAFLLSILALVVYFTRLHEKVGLQMVKKLDFWFSLSVGVLFLLASIVFAATSDQTPLEHTSIAFGFLASLVFLIDLYLLYRDGVYPCKATNQKPDNRNVVKTPGPESLPLNTEPQ